MDFLKVFDTINHDILMVKLKAYGFSDISIDLMYSYLKDRERKLLITLVQKKRSLQEFYKDL